MDVEKYSEKELKKLKRLSVIFIICLLLSGLSILCLNYLRELKGVKLRYCLDTGLYRSINSNNDIIIYQDKNVVKNSSVKENGIQLAGDISLCFLGNELSTECGMSSNVKEYIYNYLDSINGLDYINLSERFEGAENEIFGTYSGFFPKKIENGQRYFIEWITEGYLNSEELDMDKLDNLVRVNDLEVPSDVKEYFEDDTVLGYIEHSEPLSYYLSEGVYEEDGQYFIKISDLEIESDIGFVNYFGDRDIDLMELSPSESLRRINPDDRFSWVMETELTSVEEDWCTTYFRNKHKDELSRIKIKFKNGKAEEIEISGFE